MLNVLSKSYIYICLHLNYDKIYYVYFVHENKINRISLSEIYIFCQYLVQINSKYYLRNWQLYQGQIQMEMHTFNLSWADFSIYSLFNNDMYIINVKKKIIILFLKKYVMRVKFT